ncbi:hypothetical protein CF326_g2422 [Tilletia indica]|uniref:Uncharacterized protein n=1 Tax=Tilletia indica TaxID=43049 RepID=A0A177T7R6_9BASI|nr:hypothetical protein CF326_g2422 [Tilletia indica]KAE8250851.1 hypothetical protein A4X13_0g4320 [Tilletia indica]
MTSPVNITHQALPSQLVSHNYMLPLDEDLSQYASADNVLEYATDIFSNMDQDVYGDVVHPMLYRVLTEAEWAVRSDLIGWLLVTHQRCDMAPETLWRAVDILHKYLNYSDTPPSDLRIVGLTALYIAGKFEETVHPKIRHMKWFIDGSDRTKNRMLEEELKILRHLDFRVGSYTPPSLWETKISAVEGYNLPLRRLSRVFMESTLTNHAFLRLSPRRLAAAAMVLAVRMTGRSWTPAFRTCTGFEEHHLLPEVRDLLKIQRSKSYLTSFVYDKYSSHRYRHFSQRIRIWALTQRL